MGTHQKQFIHIKFHFMEKKYPLQRLGDTLIFTFRYFKLFIPEFLKRTILSYGVSEFEWNLCLKIGHSVFLCIVVLRSSQPLGVMSRVVSLPNNMFTGQV